MTAKSEAVYRVPSGWRVYTVDEIKASAPHSCVAGPFGSKISSKYFVDDGVPVIRGSNLRDDLTRFAQLIKQMVNDHHDFWLLMYIDVLEFENRHFRKMFENIAQKLRRRFANSFDDLKRKNVLHDGVDPAIGFTAAYMQFFNYFIVEKLFGGNMHFGISDEQVIERLTDIYSRGLLRGSHPVKRSVNKRRTTSTPQRSRKRTSR